MKTVKRSKVFGRRILAVLMLLVMALGLVACGGSKDGSTAVAGTGEADTQKGSEENSSKAGEADTAKTDAVTTSETDATEEKISDDVTIRIGSLKGPTTMGLVNLMKASEDGATKGTYEFRMETQPDVIAAAFASGELDIALVPANLGATLYKKTEGRTKALYVNTLGVIYCVTADESIHSVRDLAGKTVLSTGQGATPEYALAYLLKENGITDCKVEFKSEATEIAALLAEDPMQIAILPQPFVTVAEKQNEALKTAFSLTDEWDALGTDSRFLTGVTIVRSDFLEAHPEAVQTFMEEAKDSAEKAVSDVDGTAELVADYGIIEKAPIAKLALPQCNIVFLDGAEMKSALSGYLQTLFDQNPKSVGGAMPGEDFYY
ncbi:MAG: ABC transporter substrate-binding protein [Eubacterium sp.]|nr:ABC transporter substrate-binding protein [Eubacterium sp.]